MLFTLSKASSWTSPIRISHDVSKLSLQLKGAYLKKSTLKFNRALCEKEKEE